MKGRFKRFGSAKVLKNLYRKHRLESGACFDILGITVPTALGGVSGWGLEDKEGLACRSSSLGCILFIETENLV